MMNYEKSFPTFDEVLNPTLRTWNRVNIIFNIKEMFKNNVLAVKYMESFSKADQIAIGLMCAKITKFGFENTRREIIRNNNFVTI